MQEHPIEGLMKTAMGSIKEMVDVNTVVGDPVETPDGSVIIPISRVSCGFAAGGSDIPSNQENKKENRGGSEDYSRSEIPFGGGSGAGVSVQPMGFLVVGGGQVRFLPVDGNAIFDRLIDAAPNVINQIQSYLERRNDHREPIQREHHCHNHEA